MPSQGRSSFRTAPREHPRRRRKDPADPVRAFRPAEPGRTWGRETGVVHLSGIPAYMWGEQCGAIRSPAYYRRRPTAEETARHQAANPPEDARTGSAGRRMAEERTQRLLPIPCSPGKSDGAETISATGRPLLVPCAGTAQPKAAHLGKAGETIRSLATCSTHCSCISRRAIPRQSPSGGKSKVRTVCGSAASTGLCGGQRATAVPTATVSVRNPENV